MVLGNMMMDTNYKYTMASSDLSISIGVAPQPPPPSQDLLDARPRTGPWGADMAPAQLLTPFSVEHCTGEDKKYSKKTKKKTIKKIRLIDTCRSLCIYRCYTITTHLYNGLSTEQKVYIDSKSRPLHSFNNFSCEQHCDSLTEFKHRHHHIP